MNTVITLFASVCGFPPLTISVKGETFNISGDIVDLSVIPEGYRLPTESIPSQWFTPNTYVTRIDGELSFSLILPVTPESPNEMRNPSPISVTKDGKVEIPTEPPLENQVELPTIEEPKNESDIELGRPETDSSTGESGDSVAESPSLESESVPTGD